MEYREETIAKLRAKLGREPSDEEISAKRDRLWRLQLSSHDADRPPPARRMTNRAVRSASSALRRR